MCSLLIFVIFFFKQKTAYEMRISDWSSDVCSSDLPLERVERIERLARRERVGIDARQGFAQRVLRGGGHFGERRGEQRQVVEPRRQSTGLLAPGFELCEHRLGALYDTGDRKSTRLNSSH